MEHCGDLKTNGGNEYDLCITRSEGNQAIVYNLTSQSHACTDVPVTSVYAVSVIVCELLFYCKQVVTYVCTPDVDNRE